MVTAETTSQSFTFVIASEAKQSIVPRKVRMDCFVAALLAMTGLCSRASGLEQHR
jgi:hypothetical protein